jgi:hygromycin-B 4-O-kinase
MSNPKEVGVDVKQARLFLTRHLTREPSDVALIGEGAWSRCFGFRLGEEALVIRFGNHVDDFQKDQGAYAYAAPDLPIPQVLEIGAAFAGYYAISTRAYGVPLERVGISEWVAVVPAVVAAFAPSGQLQCRVGHAFRVHSDRAPFAHREARLPGLASTPDAPRCHAP